MYIQAILGTVQTKLRGKLKLSLNLGICGSGMLRVHPKDTESEVLDWTKQWLLLKPICFPRIIYF